MLTVRDKVLEQTRKFLAALPGLLDGHRGRWVVYLDGIRGEYATRDEAYAAAVKEFGGDGGFVVAPVTEVSPTPITAGVIYSHA